MSITLQKLGIQVTEFSKDRQDEAIQAIQCLRMETMIIGEGETFDWSNIIAKPDLIECKDTNKESNQIFQQMNSLADEDAEWPFSTDSLFFFTKDDEFRISLIKLLQSSQFQLVTRVITIVNIVAFCCFDYSERINPNEPLLNRYNITVEVLCNIYFGVELFMNIIAYGFILEPLTFMRSGWNIINFITFMATWGVLGNQTQTFVHVLRVIRLLRCVRFIQDIPFLKSPMNAFVGSFPRLGPILIPVLFVMLYFTIIGIHLFMGLTEYRCRMTPEPEGNVWESDPEIKNLCGIWDCPADRYCGNPADHGIPWDLHENNIIDFGYNFNRFDNFFYGMYVVFTFLSVMGWSGTCYLYWRAMTTYVTAFYFLTLIFLLAYVLSNLLLATFYESFMVKSSIKNQTDKADKEQAEIENEIQKKRQQQMMGRLAALNDNKKTSRRKQLQFKMSLHFSKLEKQSTAFSEQAMNFKRSANKLAKSRYFLILNIMMMLFSSFVLAYDHYGISKQTTRTLQGLDFFCTIYFFFELAMTAWGRPKHYHKLVHQLDAAVILSQMVMIGYLFAINQDIIFNNDKYIELWKSIKIIRLIRLLYQSRIFYSISILTRCAIQTLIKIKDMIFLWLFLVVIVALFGQELLAYTAFYAKDDHDNQMLVDRSDPHALPPEVHFNDFGNALLGSFNIFYNEEWNLTMYEFAHATNVAIFYYVISLIMGQVLFMRLLLAIFLNTFCERLNFVEQQVKPIEVMKTLISWKTQVVAVFSRSPSNQRKIHSDTQHQDEVHDLPTREKNAMQKRIRQSIFSDMKQHIVLSQPQSPQAEDVLSNKHSMVAQHLMNRSQFHNMNDLKKSVKFDVESQQSRSPDLRKEVREEEDGRFMKEQEEEEDEDEEQEDDQNSNEPIESKDPNIEGGGSTIRQSQGVTLSQFRRSDRTLFIFTPESDFRVLVIGMVSNEYFRAFNFLLIILTSIRICLLTPVTDPKSPLAYGLQVAYIFTTTFYILQILLNCIAFGLYKSEESYFRQSFYNVFTFIITLVELITLVFSLQHPLSKFITSLRILQFMQIGAVYSKDIGYAQKSLLNAFIKMIQLSIFCFIILIIYGVFALKLLKGEFYHCTTLSHEILEHYVHGPQDCMDYGGSWVNEILSFDSIMSSVCLLFIVATTEGWMPLLVVAWDATGVSEQPEEGHNRLWAIYFLVFFFIGNVCMLNMFIGLVVSAYNEAKAKAQNLHLLDETQKEWYHIKLSIFKLKPIVKSRQPQNPFRKVCFFMVKNKYCKVLWLTIIFLNTIVLSVYYHRQEQEERATLDMINMVIIIIFTFEILCRLFAKTTRMYFKDTPNVIDIIGIWICLVNLTFRNNTDVDFHFRRCFDALSIAIQLSRNFKIIKRFNDLEKLFDSIFSVIPSALSMMYIMFIFLFIYTNLGMDLFAYLQPQDYLNGWDTHFHNFTTAMFTLVRVATIELWWGLLIDSAHTIQPDFACVQIDSYVDFTQYGYNGCGTGVAFLYFITFHLIFSLVILNLFIASIIDSYDEHVKSEERAVSKYQLDDVLKLWWTYDPDGMGYINYKNFWKLSSQIAIIFGVDQSDLLDVNNKLNFLKVLNIPIYESKTTNLLCYRFHDVILSLTKISVTLKYGVTNLEPTDKEVQEKLAVTYSGFLPKMKNDFNPTTFRSGDMLAIINILKRFRVWKKRAINKQVDVVLDFSDIKNQIKKQIAKEEEEERLEEERKQKGGV